MKETQHILKGLTPSSLVIVDELCRYGSIYSNSILYYENCSPWTIYSINKNFYKERGTSSHNVVSSPNVGNRLALKAQNDFAK